MALNEQMQQMVQQDIKDAETRPKAEILKDQMDGLKTAGRTIRDIAVESIPGVSEALAEKRVDEALQRGDTTSAMIEGAAGLMGAVPMVGDAAAKGLRTVTQSLRKQDISEAEKLVDNADKLQEWRDANRLPESQRQKNIPEAQQAAEDLFQGNIKSKEARKRIKEAFPEPKLYTAENMPEMPTITDVVGSMGKKAEKGILGVKGFDLEPGQRVGARLDIPAYNEYDKWVVSIHDGKIRNGSVVGYGQAIRLKNIEFGSDPEVALDIAKGKRVAKKSGEEKPMGKATIARVFGDYVPEDPYELQEFARKVLADKDSGWTQVGMNPYRGSYFYNKETGNVVTRADEVIQVGPLVLAKNVTEPKLSELKELFSQKTARTKDGKLRIFNRGGVVPMKRMAEQMELFEPVERGFDEGGLMDEGGTVDPVSGNDVPPGSTQEEVRDDIPAQLSEGEFVFPADVVRYIGLEKLMMMRQQAKMGLRMMEEMGQMGNGDEATVPDDLPFDMYDLDIEDEEEYNSDELNMQAGGMVPTYNPRTGTYSIPGSGMGGYQPPQAPTTGYTPYGGVQPYTQPLQYTGTQYTTAEQTSNIPTFGDMVGRSPGQYDEFRTYVNDAGQTLQIPFKDGKPLYPIPEGYSEQGEEPTTEVAPIEQPLQTTQVRPDDGGKDLAGPPVGPKDVTGIGYDYSKLNPTMKDLVNKYGAGFGTLRDAFNPQLYENIAAKLGITEGVPAKTDALTSSIFSGILSNFRGFRPGQDKFEVVESVGANLNVSGLKDTTRLEDFTGVQSQRLADVTRAVVEGGVINGVTITGMRSFFENEDGSAKTNQEVRSALEAEAAKFGVATKGGKDGKGNWNRSLTTIANDIASKKAQLADRARQEGIDETAREVAAAAKAAAEAAARKGEDVGYIGGGKEDRDRMDRARDAMNEALSSGRGFNEAFGGFAGSDDDE